MHYLERKKIYFKWALIDINVYHLISSKKKFRKLTFVFINFILFSPEKEKHGKLLQE